MQETLVLIKPDAVKRQLSGEIISLSLIHISEPTRP